MMLICVICILINMGGVRLMEALGWSLYFDSLGTAIAAAMSGYLPGIIVGLFTNLIKGITDTESLYYIVVNTLIAIITYLFVRKGYLRRPVGVIALIFSLVFAGVVYWVLISLVITGDPVTLSSIWDNIVIELADKGITIGILLLLYLFLPKKLVALMEVRGWRQTPLTARETVLAKRGRNRKMSLRTKIILILFGIFAVVGVAAIMISVYLYRDYSIKENEELARGTAQMAGTFVDPEMVDAYLEKGVDQPDYQETMKELETLKASNPVIEFVYVYQPREDGFHVVFDVDSGDVPGDPVGFLVEYGDDYKPVLSSLLSGTEIDPIITNDEYGRLITVFTTVKDKTGRTVCYACADISMEVVYTNEYDFLSKLILLFIGFFILALALALWISEYNIILPINTMAISASKFAYDDEDALEDNVERIRRLDIHTGDEIENMYQALSKTTEDSEHYLVALRTKTETLSQMQNALIMVLADMVESRDESTGDHVRKTAAYTRIIMNKLIELGYYRDQLTDKFMYDVENSAPLHDIGKISVSDVILNKPGKLTEEEFEIMKTHTTAGAEIIDQVIHTVPDSAYLREAKNLAEYHHEKWNGTGYPHGLAGEEIPLSARIMAVADVFDALVSDRCYKKAFTFEKAMSIIKEDAGTHFDPKVAEAFLAAEDEVREVAEHFTVFRVTKGQTELLRSSMNPNWKGGR